jgi:hypothetical protein
MYDGSKVNHIGGAHMHGLEHRYTYDSFPKGRSDKAMDLCA